MAPRLSHEEQLKLEQYWQARLAEARKQYDENKTPETRAAYSRALRAFADVVIRGVRPSKQ